jgi:hypothetical protein
LLDRHNVDANILLGIHLRSRRISDFTPSALNADCSPLKIGDVRVQDQGSNSAHPNLLAAAHPARSGLAYEARFDRYEEVLDNGLLELALKLGLK